MKFRVIAVSIITTAFALGMAGSAGASLSHQASPAPQVSGARLASALLPASSFGGGFTVIDRLNSGNQLRSTQAVVRPSGLSCVKFENFIYVAGFGNTAGAEDQVNNPNPDYSLYPNIVLFAYQDALQFNSAQAAASFYNRARARYQQCSAFTEPDSADHTTIELINQSLYGTTVGRYQAFQLIQVADLASSPGSTFYQNTAVVLAGANVYTIFDVNGTNDPVSSSLLSRLINRVQALYRHH